MKERILSFLFLALCAGVLIRCLYWLWWLHPLALIAGLLIIARLSWQLWDSWRKDKRCEREGYRVVFIPGTRTGEEPSQITYSEGEKSIDLKVFSGKVAFPSRVAWTRMPDWAKERREEIISRVGQRYPHLVD